jgi:glycosyltransferase involved in cell wall biosynthesis
MALHLHGTSAPEPLAVGSGSKEELLPSGTIDIMKHNKQIKTALISPYPPRWCGVASHTFRLIRNMTAASEGCLEPVIVEVQPQETLGHSDMASFVIRKNIRSDYMEATDYINSSSVDIVLLQHEFSLFGGHGGDHIALLLSRLNVPILTTLHTVTAKPEPDCFQALREVCDCSCKVIVMNKQDITVLMYLYNIPENKIKWIPQGVPVVPPGGSEKACQHKLYPEGPEMAWPAVGRTYWKQVKNQLSLTGKNENLNIPELAV